MSSSEAAPVLGALGRLQQVVCGIDIVLGSATISVRDCLHLRRNAILRLSESAGSDMHVLVNGIAIARGEVVIVDDTTAIRLTDILPPPNPGGSE